MGFRSLNTDKVDSFERSDGYYIKSEDEWKEVLKNHNCLYYPRNESLNAEETYLKICEYFADKANKPTFIIDKTPKTLKLEMLLAAKKRALETVVGLSKFEKAELLLSIKWLEAKLRVRR